MRHGGRGESGEMLTGSHQWEWCVDAGQSLMVGWCGYVALSPAWRVRGVRMVWRIGYG